MGKSSFAFIEFESERDAEDAEKALQSRNMGGLEIAIEWSKRSGRFSAKDSRRPPPRGSDSKCYNCEKIGHFARDCRSRSGSYSRENRYGRGDRGGRSPRGNRSPPRAGYEGGHHRGRDYGDRRQGGEEGQRGRTEQRRSGSRSAERGNGRAERGPPRYRREQRERSPRSVQRNS